MLEADVVSEWYPEPEHPPAAPGAPGNRKNTPEPLGNTSRTHNYNFSPSFTQFLPNPEEKVVSAT